MTDVTSSAPPKKVGDLLEEVMERLEQRGGDAARPVPLPWPMAEHVFGGGLWPGLHLAAAPGGAGKTQLAAQIAKHAAKQRVPTLYLSLELDAATQVVARWLALEAGLAWSDVYLGRLEREDRVNLAAAEASLDELPLHFSHVQPEHLDVTTIEGAFAGMRQEHPQEAGGPPMLVIVDGLSIAFHPGDERLDVLCRTLARAAARHDAAAFTLLRQGEMTEAVAPGEGDPMRFLDATVERLSPCATTLSVLVRPAHDGEEAFLGVARQRFGRPGWVELLFDGTEFGGGMLEES